MTASSTFDVTYTKGSNAPVTIAVSSDASGKGSFTLPLVAADNGLTLTVNSLTNTLTNCPKTLTSGNSVVLSVEGPLAITTQPAFATICNSGTVTYSVVATNGSGGTIAYQWQENNGSVFSNLSGENSASLSVAVTTAKNGYQYRCIVSTGQCSITSLPGDLVVTSPPSIASVTGTDLTCFGVNTGTATVTLNPPAAVSVDGVIGTEWIGATKKSVGYNASAPLGNFGTPTAENAQVAYNIFTRQDDKYLYLGLQTASANGGTPTTAAAFANLYFSNGTSTFLGVEVSNSRAFVPGVPGYYPFSSLVGTPNEVFYNINTSASEHVIEFALPLSFLKMTPSVSALQS